MIPDVEEFNELCISITKGLYPYEGKSHGSVSRTVKDFGYLRISVERHYTQSPDIVNVWVKDADGVILPNDRIIEDESIMNFLRKESKKAINKRDIEHREQEAERREQARVMDETSNKAFDAVLKLIKEA